MAQYSLIDFVHRLQFADLPEAVVIQARRCLIDLIGTAAGGYTTDISRIIRNHAVRQYAPGTGNGSRLLFDGRRASPLGAALAGGLMIDSLDCHDGHVLVKGHVGVAVLPALLALVDGGWTMDEREFITALVVGYEIATRAGVALHATACDYHSSGAWNSLGCAALGARLLKLNAEQTRQALGIAEYHGPRSQIMRVVDHPTMVKDGSGWGAMAGVSAAFLAAEGFTGAPALTVEEERVTSFWSDLGERWRIHEQYFKAYPVCRWAQPAIEAVLSLQHQHHFKPESIDHIEVNTFHEGTRLSTRHPTSSDEAQYSLPFPVAAILVRGQLGAAEVTGHALQDPAILRLSSSTILIEDASYNARFPAERWAHASIILNNGSRFTSAPAIARGNPENPLSDVEIHKKYCQLAEPVIGSDRTVRLADRVEHLGRGENCLPGFLDLLLEAVSF